MICERCGEMVRDHALTCSRCGAYLGPVGTEAARPSETGSASIRQGRDSRRRPVSGGASHSMAHAGSRSPDAAASEPLQHTLSFESYGASRPDMRGNPFTQTNRIELEKEQKPLPRPKDVTELTTRTYRGNRHSILHIMLILLGILLVAFGGYVYYMSTSDVGMSAIARENTLNASEELFALAESTDFRLTEEKEKLLEQWNRAEPRIYWEVARKYVSVGDVPTGITCYRIAALLDPENYECLMELGEAYELNQQDQAAEQLYLYLSQEVATFRKEAYEALIRLYDEQERAGEKAKMLQIAYENTDNINFALERRDFLPAQPEINLTAGRYELNESGLKGRTYDVNGVPVPVNQITLQSPQGYDVYYTLDAKAKLPEEGIFYTEGVKLREGSVSIRAVCVSEDLCSDEISVSYNFFYPTPPAPKANLAPNTYSKLKTVSLRPGTITDENMTRREKAEAEKYYTFYYTIDGSTPTTNSPMYDGTPIVLPSGRVTLRAICVNQYGKSSSVATVGYKFEVTPYPQEMYLETDQFNGFVLNKTDMATFTAAFGKPKQTVKTQYLNLTNEAEHLVYDWGYAVFMLEGTSWILVRVEITSGFTDMPRGVSLGATEKEVCAAYKDFAQLPNQDGSRGLYYSYPSVGSVIIRADGTRVVQYTLQTEASRMWVLQYWLNSRGYVNKICHYYQP